MCAKAIIPKLNAKFSFLDIQIVKQKKSNQEIGFL